jgi:catechol 2,3-dioxygenase-like lactoylglutathione lyase family enzyme
VPRGSASTNRTSARTLRCAETVDWPTSTAATISPTFIGPARRASSETIWIRVGSASALNQLANSAAVTRSSGGSSSFIVHLSGRIQLALNVNDLGESIAFYTQLFGTGPAKVRPGYANFAVTEPPLKLVLLENPGQGGTLNHLGVEVASTGAVEAEQARLAEAGLAAVEEQDTTCCYARQDKFWVKGAPDGERWEIYTVLADSPAFWGEGGNQSWDAAAAELDDARGPAVTVSDAGLAPRCCGTSAPDERTETTAHS